MSFYDDTVSEDEDSAGSLAEWIADDDEDSEFDTGVATKLTTVSRSNIFADRKPNKYGLRRSSRRRKSVSRYIDPEFSKIFFENDDPRAYFNAKVSETVDPDDSEYTPSTDLESESESVSGMVEPSNRLTGGKSTATKRKAPPKSTTSVKAAKAAKPTRTSKKATRAVAKTSKRTKTSITDKKRGSKAQLSKTS